MTLLENYLRIKSISCQTVADETGLGYFCVYRTIRGERSGRIPRQAIADFLDLPYEYIWGITSARNLKRMINTEFKKAS